MHSVKSSFSMKMCNCFVTHLPNMAYTITQRMYDHKVLDALDIIVFCFQRHNDMKINLINFYVVLMFIKLYKTMKEVHNTPFNNMFSY